MGKYIKTLLESETIKECFNGNEDSYMQLLHNATPARGYDGRTIIGKQIFFEWRNAMGFKCISGGVYMDTRDMRDHMIKVGKYEYGPTVDTVVFSYNS